MPSQDWHDILSAFTGADVEFLLVRAHALAAHGLVRGTGDLDLWVHRAPANAQRVYRALVAFGAPRDQFSVEDFNLPQTVIQLGVPPLRIDIVTDISGVEWDEAWEARGRVTMSDLEIPVLSRAHMIANQRATNRPKDQLDLQWLEREPSSRNE